MSVLRVSLRGTVLAGRNGKIRKLSERDVNVAERQRGECGGAQHRILESAGGGWGLENCLEMNFGTPALDKLGTVLW